MVKKSIIGFAFFALAIASAANSYSVTFFQPVVVNGTTLKPGAYRVQVNENTAVIKQGKTVAEAPVKVENNDNKYPSTSVRLIGNQVEEIRVGGTHTKLVFDKTGIATN